MSIDARQLLELVIRPTLDSIGLGGRAAEQIVLGTAAAESGLSAIQQYGSGPALGLYQMEPETHDSLHRDMLSQKPNLRAAILGLASFRAVMKNEQIPASEMIGNLPYATAMCRIRYRWDPHPLPAVGDLDGMARTWKVYYNSRLGAGTEDGFKRAWARYVEPYL